MPDRTLLAKTSLVVTATLLLAANARAECVFMTAKDVRAAPGIELVFKGRIVEIARTGELAYRATFEVDRVWKGTAPRRLEVLVWELAPEMPRFTVGMTTLVTARRLMDSKTRDAVGVVDSEAVVWTPTTCSGVFVPSIQQELGAGYAPTEPH